MDFDQVMALLGITGTHMIVLGDGGGDYGLGKYYIIRYSDSAYCSTYYSWNKSHN